LDDRLRIGGKADFAGYNTHFEPRDFVGVLAVAHDLFPDGGDYANPKYWACLRPVTAGGPPILGESRYKNLFLNVGHGAAGWTMACSTCKAVAEIVCGRSPGMDMEGLTL
ncbi:MAG: FAD-dependent oxidoreductase, partial [Gammaproteobacteria bacterium]|nr:FAD-dependent oxidoreductase [Gammaproteobacteria bacterium]